MAPTAETSGFINFTYKGETFQTWYKTFGGVKPSSSSPPSSSSSSSVVPLVILHGGPGIPNPYMDSHISLYTSRGIPLVFYDQLGAGLSTHLPSKPPEFWSLELFISELECVLAFFGIEGCFDLLGHSWGGMLAADFAATHKAKGLRKLVIADAPASMELWEKCTNKLLDRLPVEMREMLRRHEKEGTTDDAEYQEGMQVFYNKHVCTIDPWPDTLLEAFGKMEEDPTVYKTMIGPSEFRITGTLRPWSVINNLSSISVPTLILNGLEDEAQDECMRPFFERVPRVKWVTFMKSSHMPFYEEPERYFEVVGEFLGSPPAGRGEA